MTVRVSLPSQRPPVSFDGYDLVFGVGFLMGDALATVARQFPETSFAIVDFPRVAPEEAPTNVRGLVFAEHESGPEAPDREALIQTLDDVSERIAAGEIDIPRD